MGPSMSIDGVVSTPLDRVSTLRASMGPSMSIDGVSTPPRRRVSTPSRFNGAVDEHRRSLDKLTAYTKEQFELQWGRR